MSVFDTTGKSRRRDGSSSQFAAHADVEGPKLYRGQAWLNRPWRALHSAIRKEREGAQAILLLPVAMASGAALWFSTDETPSIGLLCCAFLVAVACRAFVSSGRLSLATTLSAGLLGGMIAADFETRRAGTILLDSPLTTHIQGEVVSRDIDFRDRWRYTIDVITTADPEIRRPPKRVRLVARSKHEPIDIGGDIAGTARLQPPSGPALPGSFDFSFHAYFQGIGAHGFFYGAPQAMPASENPEDEPALRTIARELERLREAVSSRVRDVLPGDAGALASALTVADRRAIDPATVEALRASGLAHILAISGLHMALVAGTFFFLVRAGFSLFPAVTQRLPVKKVAAAGALLIAAFYLVISGASVATQRAFIMLAIVLCAVLLDKRALTMRNVALAAIAIMLITPSAVVGPGFQMSFAATAALVAVYVMWDQRRFAGTGAEHNAVLDGVRLILVFFTGLALTSLVAGIATAPFSIYHFNRIASYGLLANLAAMPIVTFVVMPFGLFAMLTMPFGLERWPLVIMGEGLDAVVAVARFVEGLGGVVVVGRIGAHALIVLIAGFVLFVLARTWLRAIGLLIVALALSFILFSDPGRLPEIVIAEDGEMVGLVLPDRIATNRKRPPKFIFEQWQRAYAIAGHASPGSLDLPDNTLTGSQALNLVFNHLDGGEPGFSCLPDRACAAVTQTGRRIIVVEDLVLIGAACDDADIVVTSKRITMSQCLSGTPLITGRTLRTSGALEIDFDGPADDIVIRSAEGGIYRAWTKHRYYDWRTRSFQRE
ncbi:MAG: ComEC/Rec2 family competence protein [Pseudomonadota bacterium]